MTIFWPLDDYPEPRKVKEASHERTHIIGFHLYETSKIRKSIQMNRLMVFRDGWEQRREIGW